MSDKTKKNKPLRIHIEGNIASGKTTLIEHLKKESMFECYGEPLQKWQNLDGENLFEYFYDDPKKYGFAFQSYILLSMAERNLQKSEKPIHIYERSIQSSKCFLKALEKSKVVDTPMRLVLEKNIAFLNEHFSEEPDLIVYVKTNPCKLFERVQNRGRSEERDISKGYLTLLHNLHEKWINTIDPSKVIVIDGGLTGEELETCYYKCVCQIEELYFHRDLDHLKEELMSITFSE